MPPVTTNTVIYKHMERRWASTAVLDGYFLIGTLDHYRKAESLHAQIADEDEATTLRTLDSSHSDEPLRGQELEFAKQVMGIRGGANISGGTFIQPVAWVNSFVFCLTRRSAVCTAFDPSYDTVVEVRDAPRFAAELTFALAERLPVIRHRSALVEATIKDIEYRDRAVAYSDSLPSEPYLIKPPKYKSQMEVRIIWHLPLTRMAPIVVRSPKAAALCQIL